MTLQRVAQSNNKGKSPSQKVRMFQHTDVLPIVNHPSKNPRFQHDLSLIPIQLATPLISTTLSSIANQQPKDVIPAGIIQRAEVDRGQSPLVLSQEVLTLVKYVWNYVQRGRFNGMTVANIENWIYERYSTWGQASERRIEALKEIADERGGGSTWQYGLNTGSQSSVYRIMFRLKASNPNSDYFMQQALTMVTESKLIASYKRVEQTSERERRIDPFILYTYLHPMNEHFQSLRLLAEKAGQHGALDTGIIALYTEGTPYYYWGVQPTEEQKEKGGVSFGSRHTMPIAQGVHDYLQIASCAPSMVNQEVFLSCVAQRLREF